jgi:hypothetical protein
MQKLSKAISRLGKVVNRILGAHLPVSVWLDSASLELYKTHR